MSKSFLKMLKHLLNENTPYGQEQKLHGYIHSILRSCGFKVDIDSIGNIYAVRGKSKFYPLLNAHMDIVEDYSYLYSKYYDDSYEKEERSCISCENCEYCTDEYAEKNNMFFEDALEEIKSYNYSHSCQSYMYNELWREYYLDEHEEEIINKDIDKEFKILYNKKTQQITSNKLRILGGDDKCGIALALQVARETKIPMKILFTVGEECGCIGIKHFIKENSTWFDDVKYDITIDRRGGNQILLKSCGQINCSNEFVGYLVEQALNANIIPVIDFGTVADVIYIRDLVPEAVNISAGYYNPHSIDEYIKFDEMLNILQWIKNIVFFM